MMKMKGLMAGLLLVGCSAVAMAQTAPAGPVTTGAVLDKGLTGVEKEFVPAAEAMPEDKYSFAPTNGEFKGARTFAQQVKHVAAVNYLVGAAILGEKPPVEVGEESGPDSIKSKAEIVKYLKDSYAYAHKALATLNDGNLLKTAKLPWSKDGMPYLALATTLIGHSFDHYGQIAIYLRMNGIVPPASRR